VGSKIINMARTPLGSLSVVVKDIAESAIESDMIAEDAARLYTAIT
jgi:hypothetical protein